MGKALHWLLMGLILIQFARPEDIPRVAVSLASYDSDYLTRIRVSMFVAV